MWPSSCLKISELFSALSYYECTSISFIAVYCCKTQVGEMEHALGCN